MEEDEKYMRRCIQLAQNGLSTTAPNPMVGAVIVCDGKIIGEGYHIRSGEGHAEVNAVRSVKDQSLLSQSTIYVSLEPCSHYGKTPPCADMLIEKGLPRIVIGCEDPFAKVHGRGIKKLRDSGREVKVGVLEEECKHLIRRFVTFNILHRPYITLKWAESVDGYISSVNEKTMISTPKTTMLGHKRRAENDAIMVGRETARVDNPTLTTRSWYGKNPMRVVVDRHLSLSPSLHLFDGNVKTLVFTTQHHDSKENLEYVVLPESDYNLSRFMQELASRGVQSLLVEGGAKLHQSFIDVDLWDEAYIEKGNIMLGDGTRAAHLKHYKSFERECVLGVDVLKLVHDGSF
jgi:diaminohydroxyphosphoribosylaminopyrimidine deaminase/5-amino-6-(5-phosphoribosylamino)uracil reductase